MKMSTTSHILNRLANALTLSVFVLIAINDKSAIGPRTSVDVVQGSYQQFFRVRPHDKEVIEDKQVEMQCHVANQAGLVQWSKDGFLLGFDPEVPGWPRYSMIVDRQRGVYNLKIKNVKLDDEAEFQCQVGPAKDNKPIRASAKITVLVPPHEINLQPTNRLFNFNQTNKHKNLNSQHQQQQQNSGSASGTSSNNHINNRLEVREAERVSLACESSPSKPETQLRWLKNGMQISRDTYSMMVKDGFGVSGKLSVTSSSLQIITRLDDHAVQYSCVGEHPALVKPIKSSITLSVLYPPGPPTIDGYADGDVINAKEALTLTCTSRGGNPPAKLIWFKEHQEIDNTYDSRDGYESTNAYSFVVGPSDNNALFKCEASNEVTTQPMQSSVRLNVLFPPTKVEIIGPRQGRVGDVITLTCVAGPANPTSEVSWVIDGRPIEPIHVWKGEMKSGFVTTTNITFTLTSQDPDTKTVACYAVSEKLGDTIVQSVSIDILYPPGQPTILGYAEGTELRAGEVYRFKCVSLGGNPLPHLRWQVASRHNNVQDRDISAITEVTGSGVSSEFVFKPSSEDHGAIYRCEASNPATIRPLTASVTLKVLYLSNSVAIKAKPKYPKSGDSLTLHCDSGACNPTCQVNWYRNSQRLVGQQHDEIVENEKMPMNGKSIRSRLKFNVTADDDQTQLSCEAVNEALDNRSVRENITLNVLFKPEFLVPPLQKFDVAEGSDVSVNLSARGNPSAIAYSWFKEGVPLLDLSESSSQLYDPFLHHQRQHQHHRKHQLLSRGPILEIRNVVRDDAGEYDCEAANSEGSARTTIVVNVLYGPSIVDSSKVVLVDPGDSAKLFCSAIGNPLNDDLISWSHNGDKNFIAGDARISLEIEKGKSSVWITAVREEDAGEYQCLANNGIGEEAAETIKLLVKTPPVIVSAMTPSIVAGEEGEIVKLKCAASGVPKVQFKWLTGRNEPILANNQLSEQSSAYVSQSNYRFAVDRNQINDTLFESVLIIKRVTIDDLNSKFRCDAFNDMGSVLVEIRLQRRDKPQPPTNLIVVNATHDSVFLSWLPGFDGGLQQFFKVRFRKQGSAAFDNSDETHNSFVEIKNLEPGTEYTFSVFARNGLGESDFGSEAIRGSTNVIELDAGEALIEVFNGKGRGKKTASKILVAVIIILGLFLVALNVSLVVCYLRWKKRKLDNNNKPKETKKNEVNGHKENHLHVCNGDAMLMKAESDDEAAEALMSMAAEDNTTSRHCEVLMMTDLSLPSTASPASSMSSSSARVVLMKQHQDDSQKYMYQRISPVGSETVMDSSLDNHMSNTPDIIKSRRIEDFDPEAPVCNGVMSGMMSLPRLYHGHDMASAIASNGGVSCTLRYPSPADGNRIQLKSILKNGNVKSSAI